MVTRKVLKLTTTVVLVLLVGSVTPATAFPSGISGVSSGCVCHNADASSGVTVTFDGIPSNYSGGDVVDLTITVTGGPVAAGESHGGFNLVTSAGTLAAVDDKTQIMDGEATHTEIGGNQRSWQVRWTAPSDNAKDVTFVAHGNSVNGDGTNSGDEWNKAEVTLAGNSPPNDSLPGFTSVVSLTTLLAAAVLVRDRRPCHPDVNRENSSYGSQSQESIGVSEK